MTSEWPRRRRLCTCFRPAPRARCRSTAASRSGCPPCPHAAPSATPLLPAPRKHALTPPLDVCQGEVRPQGLSKQYRAIMKHRVERDQVRHGVQTYQEDAHDTGMVQLTVRPAYHGCTHYGATCSGYTDQCSPAHDPPPPTSNHHLSHQPDLRPNLYTPTSHTPSP